MYLGGGAGVPQVSERADRCARQCPAKCGNRPYAHLCGRDFSPPNRAVFVIARFYREQCAWLPCRGDAGTVPVFLSEIPRLWCDGTLPLDVRARAGLATGRARFLLFGVEVGVTKPAADCANTSLPK